MSDMGFTHTHIIIHAHMHVPVDIDIVMIEDRISVLCPFGLKMSTSAL